MPASCSSDRLALALTALAAVLLGGCAGSSESVRTVPGGPTGPASPSPVVASPSPATGVPSEQATASQATTPQGTSSRTDSPHGSTDQTSPSRPTPGQAGSLATARGRSLAASFEALPDGLAARTGIVVVPVGGAGAPAVRAGAVRGGVAWSTAKVPLAIAAQQDDAPGTRSLVRRAITASDNAAAEELWQRLGAGQQAAAALDRVLAAHGDGATRTQARHVRPGFSAFGQTRWQLSDQARFAARLPCRRASAEVFALMGQVQPGQSWGLGRLDGARFKGGWGPEGGGYLVRQMGVVETGHGQAAVALVSRSTDGFEAGTRDLDRIAGWLAQHRAELPAGSC